jgi:glutamyl-tRNA synthetase
MVNYLALVGWSPGNDREILSMDQLIAEFRLEDVVPSPGFFDMKKLEHINGEYIRSLSLPEFIERADEWLPPEWSRETFAQVAADVQTRIRVMSDIPGMVDFLFFREITYDDQSWDKDVVRGRMAAEVLDVVIEAYATCAWDKDSLSEVTFTAAEAVGVTSKRHAQAPVRVAVTGRSVGPPLWEALVVLGREKTLARLQAARDRLVHG